MTDREVFRNNLIEIFRLGKIKQVDVAKYVGVSEKTVSAWITGRGYPRADAMEKLCRFLGVRQSVLTEEQNPEESMEDRLLKLFRSMSAAGQEKMLERAKELKVLYPRRKKHGEIEDTI